MEFTIHIKGLDALASAITLLAQAMGQTQTQQQNNVALTQTPSVANATAPSMREPSQPPMQIPNSPIQIPTSHVAQEFTLDKISLAMAGLIDAGKMQVITEIMKSFNVAAITQLPKEQYSALVVKLREVGAQI